MEVNHGVIYIDAFFLANLLMDMIVLLITAGISAKRIGIPRITAGSLFGAAWSVVCVAVRKNMLLSVLFGIACYTLVPFWMARIAFGKNTFKQQLRTYLILLLVTCTCGGVIQMIGMNTLLGYRLMRGIINNAILYLAIVLILVFTVYAVRLRKLQTAYASGICEVFLQLQGKNYHMQGLLDTGNRLMDPIFGKPVHVMNRSILAELPTAVRLIPYHSVGNEHGLIPVVTAESISICRNGKTRSYEEPEIALYEGSVSCDHEYDILLHSEIIE
jgi:stage II sporulation protein GA (sporulation sigma-E factor processing peptidase)